MEDQVNVSEAITTCLFTEERQQFYNNFRWWLEVPGTIIIGSIGTAFNSISILTLLNKTMASTFFNRLLTCLAIFDSLYLANRMAEAVTTHLIMSHSSLAFFVQYLYPVRSILMCCSIYITIALGMERYDAINRPHIYLVHNTSPVRYRLFRYILPIVIFSCVFYIPKWFEL